MKGANFYITTPIYYPSGEPHMGHAYSSIIADVFARFKRNDNCKVFFLTGTDEHGLKIQNAAEKAGLDPLIYCDKISKVFRELTKKLNLSNDDFIRTTEKRHYDSVNNLWNKLIKSGDIYLSKYKGWYSVSDEAYYNPDEIAEKNGKKISTFSGSSVEWVEEDSFFFKLSAWEKKLLEFYEKNDKFILPSSRRNEVINFVKSGLKDLSVSRTSFTWGIKVPNNNKHVIYVWLDAPVGYLASLKHLCDQDNNPYQYDDYFSKDTTTRLIHFIGKDIIYFHTLFWPAVLEGSGLKKPDGIYVNGFLTVNGKKMSKSRGTLIKARTYLKQLNPEYLRYYYAYKLSSGIDDIDLDSNDFINRVNSDLVGKWVNIASRCAKFINNDFKFRKYWWEFFYSYN